MIPALSYMVAAIGVVVCLYVIFRAYEAIRSESSALAIHNAASEPSWGERIENLRTP